MSGILFVKSGGLGDFLLSLPLINKIEKAFVGDKITIATKSSYFKLFKDEKFNFIDIDSKEFLGILMGDRKILLKYKKIFIPILWKGRIENADDDRFIFFGYSSFLKGIHYSEQIFYGTSIRTEIDLFSIRELIYYAERKDIKEKKDYFIIHPGSGNPKKNYPISKFIKLSKMLKNELKIEPIFLLGEPEKRMISGLEEFQTILNPDIRKLICIIKNSRFYIGNDSGVTHLSAILGVKTFSIFGPTDVNVWAPLGENVFIVKRDDLECIPCTVDGRIECTNPLCIKDIDELELFYTIKHFLRLSLPD